MMTYFPVKSRDVFVFGSVKVWIGSNTGEAMCRCVCGINISQGEKHCDAENRLNSTSISLAVSLPETVTDMNHWPKTKLINFLTLTLKHKD